MTIEQAMADLMVAQEERLLESMLPKLLDKLRPHMDQLMYDKAFGMADAAAYIGCHEDTLRAMVKAKEVPFYMIRGKYGFRQCSLDKWIHQQEEMNYQPAEGR